MRWLIFLSVLFFGFLPIVSAENCTGTISFNPDFLQFGDEFTASVSDMDYGSKTYTGNVAFDFVGTNQTHTIYSYVYKGKTELTGDFDKFTELDSTGKFNVNFRLLDGGATICEINQVDAFEVSDELISVIKIQKAQINPGEALRIQGDVSYKNGEPVNSGEVDIYFEDKEYKTTISNGQIDYSLATQFDIKSNMHELQLIIEDQYGNNAEEDFKFYINPIVSKVELETEGEQYGPGDVLVVKPKIYDQANDEIYDNIETRIYNPGGNTEYKITLLSGQTVEYKLASDAKPGTWMVKAKYGDVITQKDFLITELNQITTELQNQILTVKNVGNVKYNDPVSVVLRNSKGEKTIEKRTKLDPDDSIQIDLYKEVESGTYDIEVVNTGQIFKNIEIIDDRSFLQKGGDLFAGFTGNAVRKSGSSTSNVSSYLAVIFLVLITISILFVRYKPKPGVRKTKHGAGSKTSENKEEFPELGEKKEVEIRKPVKKILFGAKHSKNDIADFRTRILKDIKETEKRKVEDKKTEIEIRPWGQKQEKQYGKFDFRNVKEPTKKSNFDEAMKRDKNPVNENKKDSNLFKMFD